jgi:RNA polymerase sigma-70 factor, ECF subfamily
MGQGDEAELITRAVRGDGRALERLLLTHRPRLLQYLRGRLPASLRGVLEPEDVLQDALLDICRRIGAFRPSDATAFERWIITITHNSMLDWIRRLGAAKRGAGRMQMDGGRNLEEGMDVASLLDRYSVYRRTPSQSAAAHELFILLERSIERLPPNYRQVVQWRHVDGMTIKDIAKKMDRTEGAVQMLWSRALDALRTDLQSASRLM